MNTTLYILVNTAAKVKDNFNMNSLNSHKPLTRSLKKSVNL